MHLYDRKNKKNSISHNFVYLPNMNITNIESFFGFGVKLSKEYIL